MDSEYKEGREYVLSQFIKEGSYGEVHSAQDVITGFRFAVKKVTQSISPSLFFFQFLVQSVFVLMLTGFFPFLSSQIALKMFNSEEVGAWSTLRSPYVLELFGVVREGPNVFLLMDHKSGKQASFFVPFTHTAQTLSTHCCC